MINHKFQTFYKLLDFNTSLSKIKEIVKINLKTITDFRYIFLTRILNFNIIYHK